KGQSLKECMDIWREIQKSEREERATQRAIEIEKSEMAFRLRELEVREKELEKTKGDKSVPQISNKQSVKLPKFQESQDPDVFLKTFEKLAKLHDWDKTEWAIRLVPLLSGKALEAYSRLSDDDNANYDVIKTSILKRYELTSEAYRLKLRNCRQLPDESFKDFTVRLETYLKHWCEREDIGSDFGKLYDLLLREQVIQQCSKDLQLWVLEHNPKSIGDVVNFAESYQTAQNRSFPSQYKQNRQYTGGHNSNNFRNDSSIGKVRSRPITDKGESISRDRNNFPVRRDFRKCFFCEKPGHILTDCPVKKSRERQLATDDVVSGLDVVKGHVGNKSVSVLRDTGSSTVFVNSKLVGKDNETGRVREILLADGTRRKCQEVLVDIGTPFISGKVVALVLDTPFADIIVGNYVNKFIPREIGDVAMVGDTRQVNTQTDPVAGNCSGTGVDLDIEKCDVESEIQQIVVPKPYRSTVLSLAHDTPLAGHLGNKKTRERILQCFFWPGIFIDVANYCKSCPECQKGKSKGIQKAPLVPIPHMEEPFSRIAIDFVGPLPLTERKNRYILVCVDYATRYPEAFALCNQNAETVAECLVSLFSRVGVPKEILSDQGSNFMSDLMKELCRLLSIKKLSSTPYHPQTNGLVEKFNGTLKTMLKTYAMSESRNWDKHLPYVLFAYREVPNETTGFSPFELLYGRHIRGPLEILKEEWEEPSDGKTSVVSFILETRDRMRAMRQLVCMNEKVSKKKQKTYYDRKARHRVLERGQKVLLLLPTSKSKLLAQWKGPYEVVERVSPVDYRIRLSNKEHVYHINMLKRWFDREDPDEKSVDIAKDDVISCLHVISALASGESAVDEEPNEIPSLSMSGKETVDDVTICSDLTREQVGELESLLSEFSDVLSDVPKQTSLITHSVKTTTDIPIHRKPYPIPYALQDKVKKELQQMKELGIIEDSDSPYSAPMVLVKRPEASLRICIDFRELNRVTVFDPRPMPRMDDVLNRLGKAKYLSKIDLTKGYWQVPLDEDAKQKSSFVTPFGQYRFTVMPFGMVCAPATFVRLMAKVLQGYESFTEAFIDDIGVYSDTWNDHIEHLRLVFLALRESNLSAKPSKCSFGFPELVFLAHVVGNMMVKPTLDKLAIVQNFPQPLTKKQVKSFLGFVGFYRKFVQNFATLAIPLTDLTKKSMPNKVIWNETLQQAFESLKLVLLKGPVLRSPDFEKQFILRTDACDTGVGAVLEQSFDDGRHPVLYMSKKLSTAERNYAVIEKECYAIVWSPVDLSKQRITYYFYHSSSESDSFPLLLLP
ncbi:hypothetical protein ScPMuIL_016423, partial [Solemya velum]